MDKTRSRARVTSLLGISHASRTTADSASCTPRMRPGIVHNANALCAQVLVLGASVAGLPTLDDAVSSARHTASYQRSDGAWPYAERANGRWVDSFHTGFVLESLHAVAQAADDDALRAAFAKA